MSDSIYSKFFLAKENKVLHLSSAEVAFIQYADFRLNLLTGSKDHLGYKVFFKELAEHKLKRRYDSPIVIHLFYELGDYFVENEKMTYKDPLAIYIKYKKADLEDTHLNNKVQDELRVELVESESQEEYNEKFQNVFKHLIAGDCYQLNLTSQYVFKILDNEVTASELFSRLWREEDKIGSYSHGTYIDSMGKLFLSNSPECLFQIKQSPNKQAIRTMPIKGTISCPKEGSFKSKWGELQDSIKDEGELNMITDLMRNDLTKISMKPSKVLCKKLFLKVPGLVHQLSLLETELSEDENLLTVLRAIFPGGSITGAPKKNVMKLIKKIENNTRSLYCGSTVLFYKHLKSASINIRSAEIDFTTHEMVYGTGGGITLLSDQNAEYQETLDKLESFLNTIL